MRDRQWVLAVLYGTGDARRFTQDSPVLPDVWIEYLKKPASAADLIIEPWLATEPQQVAERLFERLNQPRLVQLRKEGNPAQRARVASNRTATIATLTLHELIEALIPITGWYQDDPRLIEVGGSHRLGKAKKGAPARATRFSRTLPTADQLWEDLVRIGERTYRYPKLLGLVRIAGLIAYVSADLPEREGEIEGLIKGLTSDSSEEQKAAARAALAERMLQGYRATFDTLLPKRPKAVEKLIYVVNLNRKAHLAVLDSLRTVKADAASSLFSIKCDRLTWAVIDCGIDASHPAFMDWADADAPGALDDPQKRLDVSRVKATYDFSYLRELLLGETAGLPQPVQDQLKNEAEGKDNEGSLSKRYDEVVERVLVGRAVDWEALKPLIRVDHKKGKYRLPADGHGTHVGGIIAADWRKVKENDAPRRRGKVEHERVLAGVCPDIRLIDIRVCRPDGSSDEFIIMSALQFLRYLNSNADFPAVHGANMSLSLIHDAANYACGQTPVCKESERTVSSGMVVVAAAGNLGFRWIVGENNQTFQQYSLASITDPGNADSVITVGSTHKIEPHTYGVSYFSSRGPTGDGRSKPDLVAPGEKVFAPTLDESAVRLDGTSMAAPHVSGAAALLMARHVELMGYPAKVKRILCSTATDLGRERYFQGAGLVDILRAIQSV